MKTLNYKDYIGSIEVSEEDNCLYGKVLNLPCDTAITYEGETVQGLREDFMNAIDDYIAYCEQAGVSPRKSYTGTLNIRISPETHNRIAILAKKAGISINRFIRQILDEQVANKSFS